MKKCEHCGHYKLSPQEIKVLKTLPAPTTFVALSMGVSRRHAHIIRANAFKFF